MKRCSIFLGTLMLLTQPRYYSVKRASRFFELTQPTTARPSPLALALFYDSGLGCDYPCCKQAIKRQCCVAESVARAMQEVDVLATDCGNPELLQIARKAGITTLPAFALYQDGELYRNGSGTPRLIASHFNLCKQSPANCKKRNSCNLNGVVPEADIIEFVNSNWKETIDKRITSQVQANAELDRIAASRPVIWGAPYGWWGCGGYWGGPCGWWW